MGLQSVDSTELLRVGLRAGHHGDLPIILAVYRRIFLCLLTLCECVAALFQGVVASFRAGSYNRRRTYFGSFFLFGVCFFGGLGACAVSRLLVLGFLALASRLLTASWPGAYCLVWLLGFSVSLASWLFGLSAFWPPDFLRIVL